MEKLLFFILSALFIVILNPTYAQSFSFQSDESIVKLGYGEGHFRVFGTIDDYSKTIDTKLIITSISPEDSKTIYDNIPITDDGYFSTYVLIPSAAPPGTYVVMAEWGELMNTVSIDVQRPHQQPNQIEITTCDGTMCFSPYLLQIPFGQSVLWQNNDHRAHKITFENNDSPLSVLGPGLTTQKQFTVIGNFDYYCSIHPFMQGTITVYDPTTLTGITNKTTQNTPTDNSDSPSIFSWFDSPSTSNDDKPEQNNSPSIFSWFDSPSTSNDDKPEQNNSPSIFSWFDSPSTSNDDKPEQNNSPSIFSWFDSPSTSNDDKPEQNNSPSIFSWFDGTSTNSSNTSNSDYSSIFSWFQ